MDKSNKGESPNVGAMEHHYTVVEIASRWGLTRESVQRRFVNEPGVIRLSEFAKTGKPYVQLRIPQSVLDRVYLKKMQGAA